MRIYATQQDMVTWAEQGNAPENAHIVVVEKVTPLQHIANSYEYAKAILDHKTKDANIERIKIAKQSALAAGGISLVAGIGIAIAVGTTAVASGLYIAGLALTGVSMVLDAVQGYVESRKARTVIG